MDVVNPLSIILVKSDSKGDRLLFRYPYHVDTQNESQKQNKRRSPYSISVQEDVLQSPPPQTSNIHQGQLSGFTDEVLSTLFAVKAELCNRKFELKVNDVRFVAHPTLMQQNILINIVFALHAQASYSIVKCYYELSKRLGHALDYEEKRVGYLTDEMKLMLKTHDEIAGAADGVGGGGGVGGGVGSSGVSGGVGGGSGSGGVSGAGGGGVGGTGSGGVGFNSGGINQIYNQTTLNAFDLILERSTLAQCLRTVYHDLCNTGLLNTTINQWVTLSFCLPQKAHQFHKKGIVVEPEAIDRCLQSLKPYHGMLLLVDLTELLDCVPPSGARMLVQLINAYNPLKTLQNMASEADLAIKHVYELVGHLVYWAKATIIYPLCETNVYVIAPDAPLHTNSPLVEKFSTKFPGMSLFEVISDFSLPTSIGHLTTPLQHPTRQGTLAQMVLWMLQHHLLMQLHTYVQFMPTDDGELYESPLEDEQQQQQQQQQQQKSNKKPQENGHNIDEDDDNDAENDNKIKYDGSITFPNDDDDDTDDINPVSLLSMSSQPMPVPNTSRRSITDEHFSEMMVDSTVSDDVTATTADESSNKSNFSLNHSPSMSTENGGESLASIEDDEKIKELLMTFREPERSAIKELPASSNAEDLALMVRLWQAGYFKGEHHLEEIMYFENLRRSQLLQLLDKFRDVLIIYETEDPAIATLYTPQS